MHLVDQASEIQTEQSRSEFDESIVMQKKIIIIIMLIIDDCY